MSPQEWEAAREELLVKEKELTRARDALAAERRRMPRMAVEKDYRFEGPGGPATLLDLFDGRRQLVVYRFFYDPGMDSYPERGCGGCSFLADQVAHLVVVPNEVVQPRGRRSVAERAVWALEVVMAQPVRQLCRALC